MKAAKNLKVKFVNAKEFCRKKGLGTTFVVLYVLLLAVGLFVSLPSAFTQKLDVCPTIFNVYACAPVGVYTVLIVSIPGYLISANLLPFLKNIGWVFSLGVVVVLNVILYYGVGRFIDLLHGGKSTEEKVRLTIAGMFVILLIVVLLFTSMAR